MSEGGKRWGWGVDFEERDGSLLLLPPWGGWKEVTLAVPELDDVACLMKSN